MEEKGSKVRGKIRPWALLSNIATLEVCTLFVTTIRFLRSPGLMLRKLNGTEEGSLVVVGVRKAYSEQECKEEEEGVGGNEEFCSLCGI